MHDSTNDQETCEGNMEQSASMEISKEHTDVLPAEKKHSNDNIHLPAKNSNSTDLNTLTSEESISESKPPIQRNIEEDMIFGGAATQIDLESKQFTKEAQGVIEEDDLKNEVPMQPVTQDISSKEDSTLRNDAPLQNGTNQDVTSGSAPFETVTEDLSSNGAPSENDQSWNYQADAYYDFSSYPLQITGAWKCFKHKSLNNFTKGCKWSPDGSCLLTNSEDRIMRLFGVPSELWQMKVDWDSLSEMEPLLGVPERSMVNDFAWYPGMNSQDQATCCFAVSCKDTPIHLWNAFSGELQAAYQAFNHVEELKGPHSLCFDPFGTYLYTGFNKMIRVFDVSRPGRQIENRPTHTKKDGGQTGIISCFSFEVSYRGMYAAGSYNRTIGLYSFPDGAYICELEGHTGGITHLAFSPDGTKLYSGARMDCEILCWDVRNMGKVLASLRRLVTTHQRMYFSLSSGAGRYLVSGNQNGVVTIWDTWQPPQEPDGILLPSLYFPAHNGDCISGISLHPSLPLLATGSGQRRTPELDEDEDSPHMFKPSSKESNVDNSIRLWWLQSLESLSVKSPQS